jgi:hypothetical protein
MSGPPRREFSKAPNFNILFMVELFMSSVPVYMRIKATYSFLIVYKSFETAANNMITGKE